MELEPLYNTIKILGEPGTLRHVAAMRRIPSISAITALLAAMELKPSPLAGVDIAIETDEAGSRLIYIYIGLAGVGIVAQYNAASGQWFECRSNGNFGDNIAYGGTWAAGKGRAAVPDVVLRIVKLMAEAVCSRSLKAAGF